MDTPAPEFVELDDIAAWREDEPSGPPRDRGRRLLVVACVLGGLVITVLGVLGTRVVLDELRSHSSHDTTVRAIHRTYQTRFDDCIARGTGRPTCAARVSDACLQDPRWADEADPTDQAAVDELADTCTFGR